MQTQGALEQTPTPIEAFDRAQVEDFLAAMDAECDRLREQIDDLRQSARRAVDDDDAMTQVMEEIVREAMVVAAAERAESEANLDAEEAEVDRAIEMLWDDLATEERTLSMMIDRIDAMTVVETPAPGAHDDGDRNPPDPVVLRLVPGVERSEEAR